MFLKRIFNELTSSLVGFKHNKIYNFLRGILDYNDREKNAMRALDFVKMNNLKGDYAEFGVYNGNSFILTYYFAKLLKIKEMKFYAFDSFEGLPNPEKEDVGFSWKKGDYSCSLENFKKNLRRENINLERVVAIKGWYDKTLKKDKNYGIKKLAFIHIDCDYSSSTKLALDYIKPFLQEGTIILFDDWYCYNANPKKGEQKAFNEFIRKNKEFYFIDFPAEGFKKMFLCQKR